MPEPSRIARLRITLDDTTPVIWRTVEVPLSASLKLLHEVIQAAMPFQDYHLFQFREGAVRYAIPNSEWPDGNTRSAKTTKLGALVDRGTTAFAYVYDFGDNWQHTIRVEEVGLADPEVAYPRFLDGDGRAPPEDVGGTMGFEEFLEAVTKPRHRERKRMLERYGGAFDPDELDRKTIEVVWLSWRGVVRSDKPRSLRAVAKVLRMCLTCLPYSPWPNAKMLGFVNRMIL